MIRIDLAIVAKPRMTRSDRWKKRPCVVRYWEFADKLRAAATEADFKLSNEVHMEFRIEMPKSWSKKKKGEMDGKPHQTKGSKDIDNLQKSIFDILRPGDDGMIHDVIARKFWSFKPSIKIGNKWS